MPPEPTLVVHYYRSAEHCAIGVGGRYAYREKGVKTRSSWYPANPQRPVILKAYAQETAPKIAIRHQRTERTRNANIQSNSRCLRNY
jgi:hypothetical protein